MSATTTATTRATLIVAMTACLGSGCLSVTLYEPMGALQRPTLVSAGGSSLADTRVYVRCHPDDKYLPPGDAERVCRQLSTALRRQGADTETTVPRGRDDSGPAQAFDGQGADLTVDIRSRTEHAYDYPLLAWPAVLTCTTIPVIEEETYAQDIEVRGRSMTVLASQTLRARFVTYTGWAVWSFNQLADFFFRDDQNDLSGDIGKKEFSSDFYRQISQLTFNARVRSDLLGLTTSTRALPAVLPAPRAPTATTTAPTATTPTTTATPTAAANEARVPNDVTPEPPTPAAPPPAAPTPAAPAPPPSSTPATPAGDPADGG